MSASSGIEPSQKAPSFELPNANQNSGPESISLSGAMGSNGIIIAFTCNHCNKHHKDKTSSKHFKY